ncbi:MULTISPECIES: hypothetical protein [Flavobacterium]|uniref:hypothetical protein n=1 Tax=Flavobacterium TaxID=237 RepID=UPI002113B97E|nr:MULTISPECIES: hypothetical protein [Flavobacterium]UUF13120.1 hypothetical protein NLJ00_17820 [Flavobacterium panici]
MSEKVSAKGERAAIGGYLPQFDEFAKLVYRNLINGNLEWIKVADPKAGKLDDIQFSTSTEVHAYQVKWTISNAVISYKTFKAFIPLIASSWIKIKSSNPGKKVIAHFITNKKISSSDTIMIGEAVFGSFADFLKEVWNPVKIEKPINPQWIPVLAELKKASKLDDAQFNDFTDSFDFTADYKTKELYISNTRFSKEDEDVQALSRFIIEKVAGAARSVKFTRKEIIDELNWADRFRTTFNHDLVIDIQKYQPIKSTIDSLNEKIENKNSGYIFLAGGPGTGKSTMLTQWSKTVKHRIIKYYAFDFTNPSSASNVSERGSSIHLFFDLVFQIKESTNFLGKIVPYKDLLYLRGVFAEQLEFLSKEYKKNGQKTILIIDGLDHIPREYKLTVNNLLTDLPNPLALPEGVYIVLGSQSYELEHLSSDVWSEYKKTDSKVQMDPMTISEVSRYIDLQKLSPAASEAQKRVIFEKSQGHPLYLSYLLEKVRDTKDRSRKIKAFDQIDGNIENYYEKLWRSVQGSPQLIRLLGLMARINDSVNPKFVKEWNFDNSVLKEFQKGARFLFSQGNSQWSFFHNSFRQFLLHNTALDYLTGDYDKSEELRYHSELADFYRRSETEPEWKKNYHLFKAEKFDDFLMEVTPDNFVEQILQFRPMQEIKQEAKLGVEIASLKKDAALLVRYLFAVSEIQMRLYNINPSNYTEEFLSLGMESTAINLLRTGNMLLCSEGTALEASRLFAEYGNSTEGMFLFNLAFPDCIKEKGIEIENSNRSEASISSLTLWVAASAYFMDIEDILQKINNIQFSDKRKVAGFNEQQLRIKLLSTVIESLSEINNWEAVSRVISEFDLKNRKKEEAGFFFYALDGCIVDCIGQKNFGQAERFLKILLDTFSIRELRPKMRIYMADLIYKTRKDIDLAYSWIEDLPQPTNVGNTDLDMNRSLEIFEPLIIFNRLSHLAGRGVAINKAIPDAAKGTDEELLVNFERMLCLTAQIQSDSAQDKLELFDLELRVRPIIRFYYKKWGHRNLYDYKIKQIKENYFKLLIGSVAAAGNESIDKLGDLFINEFKEHSKHWTSADQRAVLHALLLRGFAKNKVAEALKSIEDNLFLDMDITARITDCTEHANIYIDLKESAEGVKWIREAFKESIGIGYRKDYQINTWLDWLENINKLEPDSAIERIMWFLSQLDHIKMTTEGRAFWESAEKILDITCSYNLSSGFEQLKWQLENELIDFGDSMYVFLKNYFIAAENEDDFWLGFQFYTDIYLFFSESFSENLLNTILEKGKLLINEQFFESYIPLLLSALGTRPLEQYRNGLILKVKEFCISNNFTTVEFDTRDTSVRKKIDSHTTSGNELVLASYESISEKEVMKKVSDFASFKALLLKENGGNSFFDWSEIIDKLAPSLTIEQIKELSDLEIKNRKESLFFSKLSSIALAKGYRETAFDLAERSLLHTSESGWVKHFDGGTRLNAFGALKAIDEAEGAARAFDFFAHDILSNEYPQSYIQELDNILPLLTVEYNIEKYWPEIFSYLKRLMVNSRNKNILPVIEPLDVTANRVFIDYVNYLCTSPIPILKERSLKIIAQAIDQGNSYAAELYSYPGEDQFLLENQSTIFCLLHLMDSVKLEKFAEILKIHASGSNYNLRRNAIQILESLKLPFAAPSKKILPAFYNLDLGQKRFFSIEKEQESFFSDIDPTNPFELLKPFMHLVNLLSEDSGLEKENILERTYHFMKLIGSPEKWKQEYEMGVRDHLEKISLKYPFVKHRVADAWSGLMYTAGELEDCGVIDMNNFSKYFTMTDLNLSFFKEEPKPKFIADLTERTYGGVSSEWLGRIEGALRKDLVLKLENGMNIIGEYSSVKCMDWDLPKEIQLLQLSSSSEISREDYHIFGSVFQVFTSDYYNLRNTGAEIIIIRNHILEHSSLKSRWLAVNPVLARFLGWVPFPERLFAWQDKNGNMMAESVYWVNGNNYMLPRHESETGEGWYVAVSDMAIEQIREAEPLLFIQRRITRIIAKEERSIEDVSKF